MIIKIDYQISVQEMYEILTGAYENDAIDYWAETKSAVCDRDNNIIEWKIIELESSDGEKEHTHTLNLNTIERGLKRILSSNFEASPEIKQWILTKDMDTTCYDCIIQAGLYNELVYG